MANQSNPNRTSLHGRVAAEKRQAAETKQMKMRIASAWTLAKTMLPSAPATEQVKVAQNMLHNTTPALLAMLRTAAVNAHFTRIAEEFEKKHGCDIEELMDDPSILSKAENEIKAEMKADPKSATKKKADDRKDAGPQPDKYDEGKRSEPADLESSKAGERTKRDLETKETPDEKKEASAKKSRNKKAEEDAVTSEEAPAEEQEGSSDMLADKEEEHTEADDEDAKEGELDEEQGDEEEAEDAEEDIFDEEKATLQDAIEDVKSDIENLEDAIQDEIGDAEEIQIEGIADESGDDALNAETDESEAVSSEANDGGHELDIDSIFSDDNFADKVSALSNEDDIGIEAGDEDAMFSPSDASELEAILDQEEAPMTHADMFAIEGVDDDPLARLFTSSKRASDDEVVAPGELETYFETDLAGDDRDTESDHEDSIMGEIADMFLPETRDDKRSGEQEPNLKAPSDKSAKKATKSPRLATHFDPMTAKKIANGNLASLIFVDDSDFQ